MFIGHLPAGYCLTTLILKRVHGLNGRRHTLFLRLGLVAAVVPDLDMIYFYLIDQRQHPHHSYWTHLPIFWLVVLGIAMTLAWAARHRSMIRGAGVAGANIGLHLLLDSVASRIQWLYPFSNAGLGCFEVPARYGFWIWNYLLHWTFSLEVMVVIMAGGMFYCQQKPWSSKRYGKGFEACR